jgi:hypothetical protein
LLNKKFSQTNAKLGNEILKRFKIKKVTGIIPAGVLYLALSQEVTSHSGPRDLFPLRDQSSLNAEQRKNSVMRWNLNNLGGLGTKKE